MSSSASSAARSNVSSFACVLLSEQFNSYEDDVDMCWEFIDSMKEISNVKERFEDAMNATDMPENHSVLFDAILNSIDWHLVQKGFFLHVFDWILEHSRPKHDEDDEEATATDDEEAVPKMQCVHEGSAETTYGNPTGEIAAAPTQ